jgi:hypothetical protein
VGSDVTDTKTEELEGLTLNVYLYVVKKGRSVGPRDVMKGVNLSSPSVAYRHLQKLEDSGYLKKDEYGEYTVKEKAHISGFFWVGRRLVPKLWSYSLLFLGILLVEFYVLILHFAVETYEFKVFFLLLTLITGLALAAFTVEGFMQSRRKRISGNE